MRFCILELLPFIQHISCISHINFILVFQSLNYDVCENMIYQKDEKSHSVKVKLCIMHLKELKQMF